MLALFEKSEQLDTGLVALARAIVQINRVNFPSVLTYGKAGNMQSLKRAYDGEMDVWCP